MSNAVAVTHGEYGRAALYRLDKTIITHAHREGHLIFFVDGADAMVMVEDTPIPVDRCSAVAVSPWEPHSFHVPEGQSHLCLVLYIKPMWFLENSVSAEYALQFGARQLRLTDELRALVLRLTALLLDAEETCAFDQLLFGLTKASFDASWARSPNRRNPACRFSDYRVRRSLRVLQDIVGEGIEMEDLARQVGLSRPHFFKLFKQHMGVTPNVYMNTLRSERAIDSLLSSEKSITDIAFDLGYSSQASFTRFFSSNVGIAPSEYRRVAHVSRSNLAMM
ncbi:MAG: helix-turn-helix domain-containing protein [Pseudooceanicola sp.]|nr:helix-turn-helix domain-containing protein [Pseudooceanicola sp.]